MSYHEPHTAHEWLTLPAEVRLLIADRTSPAIHLMCVQDQDEPVPALKQAIIDQHPDAVVVYTTGLSFRSFLDDNQQVKQAFCYIAAFNDWKDATNALEAGLHVGYRPLDTTTARQPDVIQA